MTIGIATSALLQDGRGIAVSVSDIPNLDPPIAYTPANPQGPTGLPEITLPSGHTALHITRYDDVLKVLTDPSFGRTDTNREDGPSFLPTTMPPDLLLNLDAPDHGRMKGFVNSDYSPASVESLEDSVHRLLDRRIALLRGQENPDLFGTVLDRLPIEVNVRFLGIPEEDIDYFRPSSRVVQLAHDEDIPDLLEHFWLVYHYVTDLVQRKRPTEPGGLIDRFLSARGEVNPPLSDEELVAILLGSVLGADQNVLSVLTKAAYVLLQAPGLWNLLVEHPESAPKIVEELLRVLPLGTISTFPRIATREVQLRGGVIPVDAVVYADAFAANRDPEVFPEPELIDPFRNGKRHLQFGYGMHHCMGASLARMEITTALVRLAAEFPKLELAADPGSLQWDSGVILRRPTSLPVQW
ncbi:cytochrome P450 [Rhodococcus tibetensis]|uniref:Cytochrome P450 n=1 Tax=Rhodococcus tibetensis TaxID=2965064 RepID=A0ABT1QG44_9NOCA|nr:cytochrome P450 [Rhodococcus sp. FXJ9.536]MCQ4121218.1 cytochrome P450 [Rhodococcus sp. FXJ9.536]